MEVKKSSAKRCRPLPFFLLRDVVHACGVDSDEPHPQVLAHRAHVHVRVGIEVVDGRGKRHGVLAPEGGLRAALRDELDEPLVLRADQQDVQRERPDHPVCGAHLLDDLVERRGFPLQLLRLLRYLQHDEAMLGEGFFQVQDVLAGHTHIALGASIQDHDLHDSPPSFWQTSRGLPRLSVTSLY